MISSPTSVGAALFGAVAALFCISIKVRNHQDGKRKQFEILPKDDVEDAIENTEDEKDDEEEDEADDEAEELVDQEIESTETKILENAALRESYDNALRLAQKLNAGNAFKRAADKFTEAIDLAPKISSARNDLVSLYNNRSA